MPKKGKSNRVKFEELEKKINPLADEGDEEYEEIVVQANKKTKKKDKVKDKVKQVPKPTKEGVKKQGKRVGEAEEAAALITFLSSDVSSYTTGTAINVDGGVSPVV